MLRLRTFGGLWIENSEAPLEPGSGPRPRSLALLAICAAAGARGVSRERVLGILWPDSHPERARHALSQTLYNLRKEIGSDVVVSSADLRLDPQRISSDVDEFRAAIAAKSWADAAALYTGPFLDAFYIGDAAEFERWVDSERESLAADAGRAIETAAKAFTESGKHDEAADALRRLTRLDPTNSRFAAKYMEALARRGDRAAAIAHGRAHMELLQREFEVDPDAELEQLIGRLREAAPPAITPLPVATAHRDAPAPARVKTRTSGSIPIASPERVDVRASGPVPHAASRRRGARPGALAAAALVVAVIAAAAIVRHPSTAADDTRRPILAVGHIRDLDMSDSAARNGVSSEMLATSLARLSQVQVVASSRMLELTPRNADTSRATWTGAARRAGATEVLEGEFVPLPNQTLQLDVRRVDVANGLVRAAYRASGRDRVAVLDSVTSLIAADLGVRAPVGSFTQVSTRSAVAFRLYEEGLRSFYQFDPLTAGRLFRASLREDSTFALAAYYAWRSAAAVGDSEQSSFAGRAMRLAPAASARDRLLIVTHVGLDRDDPRALASAETLAVMYPRDPEALIRAGEVVPDLSQSIQLLNRSIALDSAAGVGETAICRLCDALSLLTKRYEWGDSDAAVQRTLARWHSLRPSDAAPWGFQADWETGFGRRSEADSAMRRFVALGGAHGDARLDGLIRGLRLDDFKAVDAACDEGLSTEDSAQFAQYRWYCTIGLRMEGRYRDALSLVHDGRLPAGLARRRVGPEPYLGAIVDLEMGRPRTAADQFLALSGRASDTTGISARQKYSRTEAWFLTLAATAWVAGNDTLSARRMVDTIEIAGSRSLFARNPLLHHFVRGLLYSSARQDDAAVREFRAAMDSPTFGYTRINYELGKTLLAEHRPRDGIPIVQAALHGGIEGSGLYLTRTELHDLLARLFDAAGQRDSARAHYRIVARAWASADSFLWARRDSAQAMVAR